MVLVDTSVWIDHLRRNNNDLVAHLLKVEVVTHPFILGELACGNIKNRTEIFSLLKELPEVTIAEHEEVLEMIEHKKLMGQGIGWVDAHLLASALISGTQLWTADKSLCAVAVALGVLY